MAGERVQKVLARAGVASRREADRLVAQGRVTINGARAELGASADPAIDRIEVDGRAVTGRPASVYLALHKPAGFVSSARDERGRRSVVRLVRERPARLWPVGRLDVDSEGLMVLTNDGDWANRVIHPRYRLEREYAVLLADALPASAAQRLLTGVELDDGPARLLSLRRVSPPPEVECEPDQDPPWVRVTLGEGRKREVRRLFAAVGADVRRLVRTRLGALRLDGLRAGEWRPLADREVEHLAPRGQRAGDAPVRIALDGPSGSGKSTIGRELARRLAASFIDTGLMYRAVALAAHEAGIRPDDGKRAAELAGQVRIEILAPSAAGTTERERVLLDGRDVTDSLVRPEVDRTVSVLSSHPELRAAMLDVQRRAAGAGSVVMAGRDIGTVVLPDADVKVFLTGSSRVRAERRAAQLGQPERVDEHQRAIDERDARDTHRVAGPLRRADRAIVLDTERLGVEACVAAVLERIRELRRS